MQRLHRVMGLVPRLRKRPLAVGRLLTETAPNTTFGPPSKGPWTRRAPPTARNLHRFGAVVPLTALPMDLGVGKPTGPRFRLPPPPRGWRPAVDLTPTTKERTPRFPERVLTLRFPTSLFLIAASHPAKWREDPEGSEDGVEESESEGSSPPTSVARSGAHLSGAGKVPNSLTKSLMATSPWRTWPPATGP